MTADWNGNGAADLAFVRYQRTGPTLWLNDGFGQLRDATATNLPPMPVGVAQILAPDVDRDGDLEFFITGGITRLFANDGSGQFTDVTGTHFEFGLQGRATIDDVDGDGWVDIIIAERTRGTFLYRNDGTGAWTNPTLIDPAPGMLPALLDFDNDGDLDLFAIRQDSNLALAQMEFLNDGNGNFTRQPPGGFATIPTHASRLLVADLENDGDQDLIIQPVVSGIHLAINLGPAGFAQVPMPAAERLLGVGDYDGDNLLDMATTGWIQPGTFGPLIFSGLDNQGGTPTPPENLFSGFQGAYHNAFFADFTGDGRNDMLWSCLLVADSQGNYRSPHSCNRRAARAVDSGDLDGDGRMDFILGSRSLVTASLQREEDRFEYRSTPIQGAAIQAITLCDVDGDGDLDAYAGVEDTRDFLLINDGEGNFAPAPASWLPTQNQTTIVEFADLDADGDQDCLTLSDHRLSVLANNGLGQFIARPQPSPVGLSLLVGDLDGNQSVDAIVGDTMLLNDLSGNLTNSGTVGLGHAFYKSHLADVDRDGDLDVLSQFNRVARLFLNSGSGQFSEVTTTHLPSRTDYVVGPADLDDDGDEDILLHDSTILENDGTGHFAVGGLAAPSLRNESIRVAHATDLDADGDQDFFLIFEDWALIGPFWNLHRHLLVADAATLGRPLRFRIFSRYGQAGSQPRYYAGRIGFSQTSVTIPSLGTWRVGEPSGSIPFAAIPTGGFGEFTLMIPNDPSLFGTRLFAQCAVFDPAGQSGLTGLAVERIL